MIPWGNGFAPTLAYCYIPEPPQEGTQPPKQVDCRAGFLDYQVSFVESHFGEATVLSAMSGVPTSWILAWSATEVGWGKKLKKPGNYFNVNLSGDMQPCPGRFGCFSGGFISSGEAALFGLTYYHYQFTGEQEERQRVPAAMILRDQINRGNNVFQAFNALAAAGYTTVASEQVIYGATVGLVAATVNGLIACLDSLGMLW